MRKGIIVFLSSILIWGNIIPATAASKIFIVAPNALVYPTNYENTVTEKTEESTSLVVKPELNGTTVAEEEEQYPELTYPLILMYHRISDEFQSDAFTITSKLFEEDIKTLKELGYTFYTATDLANLESLRGASKIAVITFDDGYESDYTVARPILEKYDACATFFIIGSKVGTEGYMTKEQVKALSNSSAAQIGNHSFDIHEKTYEEVQDIHVSMPELVSKDYEKNKQFLSEITGKDISAYSFPYGVYGYQAVFDMQMKEVAAFCSAETVRQSYPYGRFNRPFDLSLKQIMHRVKKTEPTYFPNIK